MFRLYTLNINGTWMVDMMYYITHCSFCHSSLSEILTLVMRNSTAVYKFLLTKGTENNSFRLSDVMKWPDIRPEVSYWSLPSLWIDALLLGSSLLPTFFQESQTQSSVGNTSFSPQPLHKLSIQGPYWGNCVFSHVITSCDFHIFPPSILLLLSLHLRQHEIFQSHQHAILW